MKKCVICGGEGFYRPRAAMTPFGLIEFPYGIDLCPECFFDDHRISCASRLSSAIADRVQGLTPEQADATLRGGAI